MPFVFPYSTQNSSDFIFLAFLNEIMALLCSMYVPVFHPSQTAGRFSCRGAFNGIVIDNNYTVEARTCEVGTILAALSTIQKLCMVIN
jgi:hypothetical protein